ncbi:MAG: cbb3-type cytochrome c oxidase subunit I [Bacteroidetes bacterium]|nr:cbb3-type cytochrome c oxidase subunit I [Bacteroidota bacterium]
MFGNIGGFQYVIPDFLKTSLSFQKTRPLHVTLVITWIFNGAVGGIYYYLPQVSGRKLYSEFLARVHFFLFIATGLIIIPCYFMGIFGGKEYLEFPPWIAILMLISWLLFLFNFFMTIPKNFSQWKIYNWMWATGIIFFLITFGEAYLWTLPFFNNNVVRDTTVQWKAMGSMAGSWNMLIYGTAFFVMEKISGTDKTTTAKRTFFFYFLGLTNLMFNWGHHTYIVPASGWIRNVAYAISMTELLILGSIIYSWRRTVKDMKDYYQNIPARFLSAADVWVFLNLILAIIMSVPAINFYTHGTHITVAHAMGATIGINTMILLASIFYIVSKEFPALIQVHLRKIKIGFWVLNISLFFFWISLIGMGIVKAGGEIADKDFSTILQILEPWFFYFSIAGVGVFIGVLLLVFTFPFSTIKNI